MNYSEILKQILNQEIHPNEKGEARVFCPFHDDEIASASVNINSGLFYCFGCGASYNLSQLMSRLDNESYPTERDAQLFLISKKSNPKLIEAVKEAEDNHHYLLESKECLSKFLEYRALKGNTVQVFGIGYDKEEDYFSIPIFDDIGNLRGIKYYNHNKKPKFMWGKNPAFDTSNYLYPIKSLINENSQVILVEGELDALTLIDKGFNGVSFTSGSNSFNEDLKAYFRNKNVIIIYDNDEAGKKGALNVANGLRDIVSSIKIFDWTLIKDAKSKYDITDLFRENLINEEGLIKIFSELKYFISNLEKVSFDEVFNTDNIGKEFYFETFVIGKDMTPFEFPTQISIECSKTSKTLDLCESCPLKTKSIIVNLKKEDLFNIIRLPTAITKKWILQRYVFSKTCPYMLLNKKEVSFVNEMWGIAPPNFSDNTRSANTEKEFFYMGNKEIPINTQFIFKAKIITDSQNQRNRIVCWDENESSPDFMNYSFTEDTKDRLKQFQTENDAQKILNKLYEISNFLSGYTNIYGRPLLHIFYYLIWHSTLSFNAFNEDIKRGWLQGLLIGDQRTGKSRTARKLTEYFGLGDFCNAEATSMAGLVGGVDKMPGTGNFVLKWGKLPQNDRRLLIIDEAGELGESLIGKLSEVRSEGIAQITKIEGQSTYARTRLVMISNPNSNRPINSYLYPVEIVKEIVVRPEDIARFDLVHMVQEEEVDPSLINSIQNIDYKELSSKQQAFQESIIWAWSRRQNEIIFTNEAQNYILQKSLDLGNFYDSHIIPLIQVSDARIKLARLSVAVAASVISTDKNFDKLIVDKCHVEAALEIVDRLYKKLGYYQYSEYKREREEKINEHRVEILDILKQFQAAAEYIYNSGEFSFRDLSVNLGYYDTETAVFKKILIKYGLVNKNSNGSFSRTMTLNKLIKEAFNEE